MIARVVLFLALSACSVFGQSSRADSGAGSGVVLVDVDPSGKVTAAKMLKSTGDRHFDEAALNKFRQWHFKPGTAPHVKIPVTFTVAGAPSTGSAAFVGLGQPWQKDLVTSAPPVYSYADRAAWRQGQGLFHLAVDSKTGAVLQVTIKKSTGHRTLDLSAVAALKQWRFRPGSRTSVDVPVAFVMAKSHADYYEKVRRAQQQERRL